MIGAVPLAASFDLHAHLSAEMAALLDATSGYHTYPHIDMDAAAQRTLAMLIAKVEGRARPAIAVAKVPAIMPSFNMRTADGPMAELQELAGLWRRQRGMQDVTIYGGFAYGNSPFAGPSVVAVAEKDQKLAQRCANALAAEFLKRKQQFHIRLPRAADGLLQAMKTEGEGPAIVLDPADGIRCPAASATPPACSRRCWTASRRQAPVFAFFWDPALVDMCHQAGTGISFEAKLGGRMAPDFRRPMGIKAKVLKLTDGKFRNEGPYQAQPGGGCRTHGPAGGRQRPCDRDRDLPGAERPGLFSACTASTPRSSAAVRQGQEPFPCAFADMARCLVDVDCPAPPPPDCSITSSTTPPNIFGRRSGEVRQKSPAGLIPATAGR